MQKTETHPLLEFFYVCVYVLICVFMSLLAFVYVCARPFVPSGSPGRAEAMRNPTAVVLGLFFFVFFSPISAVVSNIANCSPRHVASDKANQQFLV